ncbi:uncharacterized protein [Trachinotus anak]|uniref:uncharacterized protein isoform X9 n=1 Tax=Trachinotus anak TaxID=443729 RepID=UPI0039F1DB29
MNLFQSGRQILNGILNPPADIKHHGLLNQGATCYLNSVLQVLFMTEDFREAVERYICENPGSEYIDRQLKDLFDDLKERNTYTYKITKKLGIYRVYEQQDAAEYFEKILALTSSEASQIFHGQLTHKTICSECLAERNTDGPFWHLPLELVDPGSKDYSVVDGTKEYFTASHFSGENQMYCEHCDAKSDATIRCVVKHHPEVLMLLLKRFEFDYRYMMYVKNNCVVDVPYTLQIPENQTYELYAMVDHYGDLRGGHYTATVKSQDGKTWYNFNDTRVTLLSQQLFQTDNTEKSHSVYLLFYRKKKIQAADTCAQDTREELTSGGFLLATNDNNDQCQDGEQIREREEDEEMVEVGNDTAEAGSINKNEEREIRNMVSVGSGGVELSPDLTCNVEHQDSGADVRQGIQDSNQGWDEEKGDLCDQDSHTEKLEQDEEKRMRDDEEGGKKENSSTKYLNMDKNDQDNERLDTEEKMDIDVKDDKEVNTEADKLTPGKRKLLTKYDLYLDTFWNNGRVSDSKQNKPEVEQENKGNQQIQSREDSSRTGLERKEKLTENQEVESLEKPQETTGVNEVILKGEGGSKRSKIYMKIIEEEVKETPSGTQRWSETEIVTIPTVETSKDCMKGQVYNEGSTDGNTLCESLHNSWLNDSPLSQPQTRRNKRDIEHAQEENETNSTIHTKNKKRQKVSDAQIQTAGIKHAMKKRSTRDKRRRWWHVTAPLKKHRKRKKKYNKTTRCFS